MFFGVSQIPVFAVSQFPLYALPHSIFVPSISRWFCHVDDDTYVNIPALLKTLQQYNHTEDWYLGKPSLSHPIELYDVEYPSVSHQYQYLNPFASSLRNIWHVPTWPS